MIWGIRHPRLPEIQDMRSSVLEGIHQINLNSEKVPPNPEWHPWTSGGPGGSHVSRKVHHVVNLQYTVKNKPVGLWSYHLPKCPGTGLCAKCFDSELGVLNLHDHIQTGYYSGFKIWSVFLKKRVKELPWKTEGLFIKGDFLPYYHLLLSVLTLEMQKPLSNKLPHCCSYLGHKNKMYTGKILLRQKLLRTRNSARS